MMAKFGAQSSLDQGFLERHRGILNRLGGHRALYEMGNQVLGNAWQLALSSLVGLGFAWHTCSLATCYALNTKFLTGPLGAHFHGDPRLRTVGPGKYLLATDRHQCAVSGCPACSASAVLRRPTSTCLHHSGPSATLSAAALQAAYKQALRLCSHAVQRSDVSSSERARHASVARTLASCIILWDFLFIPCPDRRARQEQRENVSPYLFSSQGNFRSPRCHLVARIAAIKQCFPALDDRPGRKPLAFCLAASPSMAASPGWLIMCASARASGAGCPTGTTIASRPGSQLARPCLTVRRYDWQAECHRFDQYQAKSLVARAEAENRGLAVSRRYICANAG